MERQYSTRSPAVKRLMREAQELHEPTEQYFAQPLEDNLFEWHFTLRGPGDSEFDGGIYHGRIILPPEYPMKPPSIILLTPNGRFEVHKKICLSISGHHPESWQPSWSIRTALLAIIGFMPTHGNGAIGSLDYTPEERKVLARKTRDWKCPVCGDVTRILKPVTEASKAATEEAKELASQIAFQGEKEKKESNSSESKEGASGGDSEVQSPGAASNTSSPPASPPFAAVNPQMFPGGFPHYGMPPFMPGMTPPTRPGTPGSANQMPPGSANQLPPFWPPMFPMSPQAQGGGNTNRFGTPPFFPMGTMMGFPWMTPPPPGAPTATTADSSPGVSASPTSSPSSASALPVTSTVQSSSASTKSETSASSSTVVTTPGSVAAAAAATAAPAAAAAAGSSASTTTTTTTSSTQQPRVSATQSSPRRRRNLATEPAGPPPPRPPARMVTSESPLVMGAIVMLSLALIALLLRRLYIADVLRFKYDEL